MKILLTFLFYFLFISVLLCQPIANFTSNVQSGCSPLIVQFNDASTEAISWNWDFHNGITSTEQNPSTIFKNPGFYNVTLTINNGAVAETKSAYIQVFANPKVNFSASGTYVCTPYEVRFIDSTLSTTPIKDWRWDFGDTTSFSYKQNPTHIYTKGGRFSVSLRVTDVNGCTQTLTQPGKIVAGAPSNASFNYTTSDICNYPATVNFKNTSVVPDTLTYQWSFGDGGTSTAANPTYKYNLPGYYKVDLLTANYTNVFCQHKQTQYISIAPPVADFNFSGSLCGGTSISFIDSSSPKAHAVEWDFGDGSKANGLTASHVYNKSGTYTVTQTASFGSCEAVNVKTIIVDERPDIKFTASGNLISCNNSETINFENQSTGAVNYQWLFGDGTNSYNSLTSHTYNNPGNYNVSLVAYTNAGCADTLTKKNLVQLSTFKLHNIQPLPVTGCVPATVNFSATAQNNETIQLYKWDLGDGNPITTSNPSHTYNEPGGYTISLIATNIAGCSDTVKYSNGVALGSPPAASFTSDVTDACANSIIAFKDLSKGNITAWLWSFGDGTFSYEQNPSHQYNDTGFFNVKLTVYSNGCGDSITKSNAIHIKPPIANFSVSVNCQNGYDFGFNNYSKGSLSNKWSFGDGSTSTDVSPRHTYTDTGSFTATLNTTNGACKSTKTATVYVITKPADITYSPLQNNFCKYDSVLLYAYNFNRNLISSYNWVFGDGLQTGTQYSNLSAYHQYLAAGDYNPYLIIRNLYGCYDTLYEQKPLHVKGPIASFINDSLTICIGVSSGFEDLSLSEENPIVKWDWNFGDGTIDSSNSATVTHTYNDTGFYTVKLKVTDSDGCYDSLVRYNSIQVQSLSLGLSPDTTICKGETIQLSGYGGEAYQWSPANSLSCADCETVLASPSTTTTYTLNAFKAGGCAVKDSVKVSVQQPSKITVSNPDSACAGKPITITANGFDLYNWVPYPIGSSGSSYTGSSVSFIADSSVNYKVVGTDAFGCFADSALVNVKVYPNPRVIFQEPVMEVLAGSSRQLFPMISKDINSLVWSPVDGLSCSTCEYPFATPKLTTIYTLSASNVGNCRTTANVKVIVLCNKNNVFIPNTFSPNNDGVNDRFYVQGNGVLKVASLKIYNRWGKLCYSGNNIGINNPQQGWDGKVKNLMAPAGVYIYMLEIECENNGKSMLSGNITLLR